MDEYSEVMITMACAVYASKIIPKETLDAMEGERISALIPHLVSFREEEIAEAAGKKDHAGIDIAYGKSLLAFVEGVSAYLPEKIGKIVRYLYSNWLSYTSRQLNPPKEAGKDDPLNYGKDEFSRYLSSSIEKMSSGLSAEDRSAVEMLSRFVIYQEEMKVDESRKSRGLWALIDLLHGKTSESEALSRILHSALIREEIWKNNLFAG